MKKNLLVCCLFFGVFLPFPPTVQGDFSSIQSANLINNRLKSKIKKGLDFLARKQSAINGTFSQRYQLATASLAGLAFLSYPGSSYKRGPYGRNIARILSYILQLAKDRNGKIKRISGLGIWLHDGETQGRMHAHCYATLFLAEVYGTLRSGRLENQVKKVLQGAVEILLKSQTSGVRYLRGKSGGKIEFGGWGYYHKGEPQYKEDEASVTVCVLQALRAARNCGISIPSSSIRRAINYIKLSMRKDGAVRYSLARNINRTSFEITAAAVSTLNAAGVYRSHELNKGLHYLQKAINQERATGTADEAAGNWYYYGNFYAAQAMYQAGDVYWKPWYREVKGSLLNKQKSGGYWENRRFGPCYATSMALLILQMPFHNLPIFQR